MPTSSTGAGLLGIGDAARYLGVSEALLRKREQEGAIHPSRHGAKRERRYSLAQLDEWAAAGLIDKRPPGRASSREVLPERVRLSYEDEQEALRIAQAVTTSIVRRVGSIEWDDAFSDALVGVATALSRPTSDCPWNVACFAHARWAVLSGISKRSGVPSTEYAQGRRWVDLPPWRQPPESLDAALAETASAKTTALDNATRVVERVTIEHYLDVLDRRSRLIFVNAVAHRFTDTEIADALGMSRSNVQKVRHNAERAVRDAFRDERLAVA